MNSNLQYEMMMNLMNSKKQNGIKPRMSDAERRKERRERAEAEKNKEEAVNKKNNELSAVPQ